MTVVRCDPEFTREDVALLLADQLIEADTGPHGIPMSEALDPANQGLFEGYLRTDYAQKAIDDAKDLTYQQYPNGSRNGHRWSARRRSSG